MVEIEILESRTTVNETMGMKSITSLSQYLQENRIISLFRNGGAKYVSSIHSGVSLFLGPQNGGVSFCLA